MLEEIRADYMCSKLLQNVAYSVRDSLRRSAADTEDEETYSATTIFHSEKVGADDLPHISDAMRSRLLKALRDPDLRRIPLIAQTLRRLSGSDSARSSPAKVSKASCQPDQIPGPRMGSIWSLGHWD